MRRSNHEPFAELLLTSVLCNVAWYITKSTSLLVTVLLFCLFAEATCDNPAEDWQSWGFDATDVWPIGGVSTSHYTLIGQSGQFDVSNNAAQHTEKRKFCPVSFSSVQVQDYFAIYSQRFLVKYQLMFDIISYFMPCITLHLSDCPQMDFQIFIFVNLFPLFISFSFYYVLVSRWVIFPPLFAHFWVLPTNISLLVK